MPMKEAPRARIGLYTAGLNTYWTQFEGLKERILGYNCFIADRVSAWAEVYNFGLVDSHESAREAGEYFNAQQVDLILAHSGTYFTSTALLPVHQICKAPVVMLNLQPAPQMNYARTGTGEWLAHCVGCPVPEAANVFDRAGIRLHIVNGLLGLDKTPEISVADEVTAHMPQAQRAWREIEQWVRAAGVKRMFQQARFGFLGNYYSGMLDMYSDFTLLQAQLGLHIEILEMCDLNRSLEQVQHEEIQRKKEDIASFFEISGDSPSDPRIKAPTQEQLNWSATVAAAQYRMVREYDLDALSYYYHGSDNNAYEQLQSGFIVGHSLLTADGVPCAGEADIKTCAAMKICDHLGVGGSFCEIVAMDYVHNTMLLGHDGPFHISISDGKPMLRGMGVYHGKKGSGVSVEANVVNGPVTMLGLTQVAGGKLRLFACEGTAVKHPILTIGNTQTHVDFGMDLDEFMDKWFACAPTHHCAMSVGHNAKLFEKAAELLGVEFVRVS